jgi:hypothetical protein
VGNSTLPPGPPRTAPDRDCLRNMRNAHEGLSRDCLYHMKSGARGFTEPPMLFPFFRGAEGTLQPRSGDRQQITVGGIRGEHRVPAANSRILSSRQTMQFEETF